MWTPGALLLGECCHDRGIVDKWKIGRKTMRKNGAYGVTVVPLAGGLVTGATPDDLIPHRVPSVKTCCTRGRTKPALKLVQNVTTALRLSMRFHTMRHVTCSPDGALQCISDTQCTVVSQALGIDKLTIDPMTHCLLVHEFILKTSVTDDEL